MAQLSDDCFAFGGKLMTAREAMDVLNDRISVVVEPEQIPLRDGLGRYLAEDIASDRAVPPHDNAAVDGFAVRFDDLDPDNDTILDVTGRVAAGHPLGRAAQPGEAIRIFTGAPMPDGPDTVLMQEDCRIDGDQVIIPPGIKRGANRRHAGEDIAAGDIILRGDQKVAAALRARVDEAARDPATGAVDPIRLDTVSVDLALAVFAEHPWLTAEVIGWHVFRATGHVNPFQLYFFYDQIYKPRDGVLDRRQTEARYSYLPWIAAYSFLVLVPVLIGWAVATRALWRIRRPGGIRPPIPLWLHLLLTLMILYYPAIGGWLGNDRYILPNILPYSVYWALALTWLTAHWRLRRAALRS